MTDQQSVVPDARMQAAIAEMQELIQPHHPSATFRVGLGEDPEGVWLTATVDVDDPDEVVDLFIDRLLEIQIEEGVPLHLFPVRTPERIAAMPDQQWSRPTHGAIALRCRGGLSSDRPPNR